MAFRPVWHGGVLALLRTSGSSQVLEGDPRYGGVTSVDHRVEADFDSLLPIGPTGRSDASRTADAHRGLFVSITPGGYSPAVEVHRRLRGGGPSVTSRTTDHRVARRDLGKGVTTPRVHAARRTIHGHGCTPRSTNCASRRPWSVAVLCLDWLWSISWPIARPFASFRLRLRRATARRPCCVSGWASNGAPSYGSRAGGPMAIRSSSCGRCRWRSTEMSRCPKRCSTRSILR